MRLLNLMVICALILAAAVVYKIKFDSTLQSERAAKLRTELRRERDAIAALKAEWAKLETPARLEALARRHLQLQPMTATQFDTLGQLPERPPSVPRPSDDPVGAMIESSGDLATGSVAPQR